MDGHFADLMFTPTVQDVQRDKGSRRFYERHGSAVAAPPALGPDERAMIVSRDSFYMATISETGWPYVQFRGGPRGFVKVLDTNTIGFADFRGNRQYVSVGNLRTSNRAALIMIDYPTRSRLKLLGRTTVLPASSDAGPDLSNPGYRARVEQNIVVTIEAYDWNCPQHITPRYTEDELAELIAPLRARIADLEGQLAAQGSR